MSLHFTCSNCATRLKVHDDPQSRSVICPTCGTKQVVVMEGRAAEGPVGADAAPERDGKLRSRVFLTYMNLRVGMGVIALVFPLLLLVGGYASGLHVQDSIGAYYHTPMRNFFVGGLFALGSFLFLYKGFTRQENYALNVAGVLAVLIAVVPIDAPSDPPIAPSLTMWLHRAFGYLFFLAIAYVCIFRAADTTPFIASRAWSRFYRWMYKLLGVCMIVVPGVVFFLVSEHQLNWKILLLEWVAIWLFAAYWLLKSKEIKDSQADQRVPLRERDKIRVGGARREEEREKAEKR